MPFVSRRDRARREEMEEFGDEIHSVELDADGKPCRACTAAKKSPMGMSIDDMLRSGQIETQRQDCPPDVNQIGNSSWVGLLILFYSDVFF